MRKITYILMILFIIVLMSACNWVDSDAAFKKAIDEAKGKVGDEVGGLLDKVKFW